MRTKSEIQEIYGFRDLGYSYTEIARITGNTRQQISGILRRRKEKECQKRIKTKPHIYRTSNAKQIGISEDIINSMKISK